MYHIRENEDGSHRVLSQSEANREDNAAAVAEAIVATGAPITAICWIPTAFLVALKFFGLMSNHDANGIKSLVGIAAFIVIVPAVVGIGVMLKRMLGNCSGIAGLIIAYQMFVNFG